MHKFSAQNLGCVIHCRVSTGRQAREGESLETHTSICEGIAKSRGWQLAHAPWREAFSGRKEQRPVFDDVLSFIDANPGKVRYYLFRSIDRFTRAGNVAYGQMKFALAKRGVELVDSFGIIQPRVNTLAHLGVEFDWSWFAPSEISELVLSVTSNQEITTMLTRMIGAEIALRQKGYKVRRPTDGFKNERIAVNGKECVIEVPHEERAKYFVALFDMRISGQFTDKEIANRINAMGYRRPVQKRWNREGTEIIGQSGGGLLTPARVQEIVQRTAYCGVICEKWTHWKPIKSASPGLISIDKFNAANRGKVRIQTLPDGSLELLRKDGKQPHQMNNPIFPFKNVIGCPSCRAPLMGSAPRSRNGKYYPTYHCSRKHKYFGVGKATLENSIGAFTRRIRLQPQLVPAAIICMKRKYEERQTELAQVAQQIARSTQELETLKAQAIKAFKLATSDTVRLSLEADVEDYDRQIAAAEGVRNTARIGVRDIDAYMEAMCRILEHPAILLENPVTTQRQRARYGVLFDGMPTYAEIASGTPRMRWIVYVVADLGDVKSGRVRLEGLSWNQIEETILEWKESSHLLGLDESDGVSQPLAA